MSTTALSRLAAALAALAIILGALGAHGKVHNLLAERGTLSYWETAVFYHLVHAVALWALAAKTAKTPAAAWLLVAGIAGFSGSLYILALNKLSWLGPVTPLGGLLLVAGWIFLAVKPVRPVL